MKAFALSDIGRVRDQNQDAFIVGVCEQASDASFACVCDGMGGHNAGQLASLMALANIKAELEGYQPDVLPKSLLTAALAEANAAVWAAAQESEERGGMGTTAVAAMIIDSVAHIVHAGDSRAYLLTHSTITQITKDHSYVQALVDKGEIRADEAATHPEKNRITRAVGAEETLRTDYNIVIVPEGSALLLCSDGLTNMVSDSEILAAYQQGELETLPQRLIDLANAAGGRDNITVVVMA